jgi:uncharacterized protein YcbK (DUF882 family)
MRFPTLVAIAVVSLSRPASPTDAYAQIGIASEQWLGVTAREPRTDSWAVKLAPIEVKSAGSTESAKIRLYASSGEVDDAARDEFERLAANVGEVHALAERLEKLVFKAAYRFGGARVDVLSGWRENAGRHSAGEALDFKLHGVTAATLAAYLRTLPRVGVGIYTHPRTQFVHLDVRDESYYWLDASPPGIRWRAKHLRDPRATRRDATWLPEMDLP